MSAHASMMRSVSRGGLPARTPSRRLMTRQSTLRGTSRLQATAAATMNMSCPWTKLGVTPGASADEVKSAFRKLAKQLHPDVCKAPDAEQQFIAVQQAYEMLSGNGGSLDAVVHSWEPSPMSRGNRTQWQRQVSDLKRRPSSGRRPSGGIQKSPSAKDAERRARVAAQLAGLHRTAAMQQ